MAYIKTMHKPTIRFILEVCRDNPNGFTPDHFINQAVGSSIVPPPPDSLKMAILKKLGAPPPNCSMYDSVYWDENKNLYTKKYRINNLEYLTRSWGEDDHAEWSYILRTHRDDFDTHYNTLTRRMQYRRFVMSRCRTLLGHYNVTEEPDYMDIVGSLALLGETSFNYECNN